MTYKIQISKKTKKNLLSLHPEIYKRTSKTLKGLSSDPKPTGSLKLSGRNGYRIRIGAYRIIYEIDDSNKIITILDVGHRSSIYDS